MDETDQRARKHHIELLTSGIASRDILKKYFSELEEFMKEHKFAGCPFTNTAQAVQGQSEEGIEKRIENHKNEIRSFFRRLCEKGSSQPKMLAEAFFLMYSGATTESANIGSLAPILAGKKAALALFDMHTLH